MSSCFNAQDQPGALSFRIDRGQQRRKFQGATCREGGTDVVMDATPPGNCNLSSISLFTANNVPKIYVKIARAGFCQITRNTYLDAD